MAYPSDLTRTKNWGTEILTDADLEGQLDLIINWAMAVVNASTGHTHDGTSNNGPKIPITNLTVGSQALGDIIYSSSSTAMVRLAGNTTATKKFLTQTGDGSLSTAPGWNVLVNGDLPAGTVLQVVNSQDGAVATGTTVMVWDDTIPQNTEGDQYMSLAITPASATNKLKIEVVVYSANSNAGNLQLIAGLFQDSTADALAVGSIVQINSETSVHPIVFTHYMTSGTTSSTTFKVRAGAAGAGTTTFNGTASARKFGGVMASSITITEIKA